MSEVLEITDFVLSGTDVGDVSAAIPDGKKVTIGSFSGSAPASSKAVVRVIWDFGGAGEEDLWEIQNDQPMPYTVKTKTRTGDGVKKLAICLTNACTGDYWMSGHLDYEVEP